MSHWARWWGLRPLKNQSCAYKSPSVPLRCSIFYFSLRFSFAISPPLSRTADPDFDGFHVLFTQRRQLSLQTHL